MDITFQTPFAYSLHSMSVYRVGQCIVPLCCHDADIMQRPVKLLQQIIMKHYGIIPSLKGDICYGFLTKH